MANLKSFFNKLAFSKGSISLEKVIQKLIYVLVFLLPLWFLPITINAVEFNKQVLLVLLVVITFILWLIKILNQGEATWKSDILNVFLGIFLIVCVLATIFLYDPTVAWLAGQLI